MRFSIDLTEAFILFRSRRDVKAGRLRSPLFGWKPPRPFPPPIIRVVRPLKRVDVAAFIPAHGTRWSPWRRGVPSGVRCAMELKGSTRGLSLDRSPRWIYWLAQGSVNEREKEREEGNPTYSAPLKKIDPFFDSYLFPDLVFRNKEKCYHDIEIQRSKEEEDRRLA